MGKKNAPPSGSTTASSAAAAPDAEKDLMDSALDDTIGQLKVGL